MNRVTTKVVHNKKSGCIQLTKEATNWMKQHGYQAKFCDREGRLIVPRHNPIFVACIEELGGAAYRDPQGTELHIAEIDGDKYCIIQSEHGERVITEKDLISSKGKSNQQVESFDPDKVWFTSDTHFFHENIIRFCGRPFNDVEEMNEALIKNWNEAIPEDGVVFHLGDFAHASLSQWEGVLRRLNGTIHMIIGNHDESVFKHRGRALFATIREQRMIEVGGQKILLNHYPFLSYAGAYNNVWQLFGHVHSGPRSHTGLDLPRLKTLFTFQYDVGVDNNEYRPISFSQLCEIFKTQAQKAGGQKVEASSIMPSGMPIVFLDVDGVLVSDPTTRQAAVAPSSHLSWLLRESGAGLVIIGGWAAYDIDGLMNGPLKEYSWCLKGATPRLSSHSEAIAQWLSTSGGKHPYVILSAASVNDNRAIAVNPKFGLSRNDAHKAIKLFKNKYE